MSLLRRLAEHPGGVSHRGGAVRGGVGQRHQAARGERTVQPRDQAGRVSFVADVVQYGKQQDGHRQAEVDEGPQVRIGEDRLRRAQVAVDDGRAGHAVQHVAGVREHHRVVIDVDDPGVRAGRGGHLVGVAGRGQARPDVDDLADADLADQVPDDPAEEFAVLPDREPRVRQQPADDLGGLPVDRVVVLAAEQAIVDACRARDVGTEGGSPFLAAVHGQTPRSVRAGSRSPLSPHGNQELIS
jgi:hypothetical protein